MRKLFGRTPGGRGSEAPLINKTVQVGQFTVLCEALLGSGGYADIYRTTELSSGARYALKHLRLGGEPALIAAVQAEAKAQARLRGHPNVLRLHAVAFAGPRGAESDGFFLLDYCPGTLLDLLGSLGHRLEEATVLHIAGCVASALAHMHAQRPPMIHRDVKAENVLMLPDGTWVLCDYGSVTTRAGVYDSPEEVAAAEDDIRRHTTPAYRAPEMWDLLQRHPIGPGVDVWALGVLTYVLAYGRLPFKGESSLEVLSGRLALPPDRHPQLRALIRSLLTVDPVQRPSISDALAQLEAAAQAITGRGLTLPAAGNTAVNGTAPAPTPAPAPTAAPAPTPQRPAAAAPEQQRQQPQPAQQAVVGGRGLGVVQAVPSHGAASAHGAAGAAARGPVPAATQPHSSAPPPPQPALAPASAAQGVRAHALSTPDGSPARGSSSPLPSSPALTVPGVKAGHEAPAAASPLRRPGQQHRPEQTLVQQQQQYAQTQAQVKMPGGVAAADLSALMDIRSRAAASAAAREQQQQLPRRPPPEVPQTSSSSNSSAAPAAAVVGSSSYDSKVLLERKPQPYASSAAASTRAHSAGTDRSSATTHAADARPRQAGAQPAAGVGGLAHTPPLSQQQQRLSPASAPTLAADGDPFTVLRLELLGEVASLRTAVAALSSESAAYLLRIRQLEEFSQSQAAAIRQLQAQLARLGSGSIGAAAAPAGMVAAAEPSLQAPAQQQHATAEGSSFRRGSTGADGAAAAVSGGGTFWSTQSASGGS